MPQEDVTSQDERTGKVLTRQLRRKFEPSRPTPDPPTVDCPRGTAILVRGTNSWAWDANFEVLERELTKRARIQVIRFSYNGPRISCYTQWDVAKQLAKSREKLDQYLDEYIRTVLKNSHLPLYLLGHSAGGDIIASWICRRDVPGLNSHLQLVERINKIFFLATPFFPKNRFIPIQSPGVGEVFVRRADYEIRWLLRRCPIKVTVLRCEKDALFSNPADTSLKMNMQEKDLGPNPPLFDEAIKGASHQEICNHKQVVKLVMRQIDQDLSLDK